MLLDALIQDGIGKGRVIAFVVSPLAIADEINHHINFEFLSAGEGELYGSYCIFGIVAIYVEYGRSDGFSYVSCI